MKRLRLLFIPLFTLALVVPRFAHPNSAAAPPTRVAIVGGGLSGLVVAYRLSLAGIPFILFESELRLGGRVRTEARPEHGRFEMGAELINTDHRSIQSLARELELDLTWRTQPSRGQQKRFLFGGRMLSHAQFSQELFANSGPALRRLHRDVMAVRTDSAEATRLENMTVREYLDQTLGSRDSDLRVYLEVVAQTEMGQATSRSSARYLLTGLAIDLAGESIDFMPDYDEAIVLENGTQSLVDRLLARIDDRSIRLGHRVRGIERRTDGRFSLDIQAGETSSRATFEQVVLASSLSNVRDLPIAGFEWPADLSAFMRAAHFADVTKVVLRFSQPFWLNDGETGRFVSDLGITTWDSSRRCSGCVGQLTLYLHEGGEGAASIEARVQAFVSSLTAAFPSESPHFLGSEGIRWPMAYTVPTRAENSASRVENVAQHAIPGLTIVGDAFSVRDQGYMNGAVETAERAAARLIRGRTVRPGRCQAFFERAPKTLP